MSTMQLRLREEFDMGMGNEQIEYGLFETYEDNIFSYGCFENLCMMEMEVVG